VTLLRSLLFVPASQARRIDSAARSGADGVILDLEDGVAPGDKTAARALARGSIARLRSTGKAPMVRVNGIETGVTRDDVLAVVCDGLASVVLPKVQAPQDLRDLDVLLREAEMANGVRPGTVGVLPIIESARAVLRCEAIARAIDRVTGIAVGGEDYTAEIGVERDAEGLALQHIRGVVVQVAAAYGLAAIDSPYIDFKDARGLERDARIARAIGLKGKLVIHPDQIEIVNRVFSPSAQEIARARRIIDAFAAGDGSAISVDGRMVDAPVAERAKAVVALAATLDSSEEARRTK